MMQETLGSKREKEKLPWYRMPSMETRLFNWLITPYSEPIFSTNGKSEGTIYIGISNQPPALDGKLHIIYGTRQTPGIFIQKVPNQENRWLSRIKVSQFRLTQILFPQAFITLVVMRALSPPQYTFLTNPQKQSHPILTQEPMNAI